MSSDIRHIDVVSPHFPGSDSDVRRVGLLGGTFDPPHLGHLVVAHHVRVNLGLDEVRLVVANDPWQKTGERHVTPAADRLALTAAAVDWATEELGTPGALTVSRVELDLGGESYTADTLEHLIQAESEVEWTVIVGSDAAAGLDTWHRADDLKASASFAVVARPGRHHGAEPPPGFSWQPVPIPAIEVSSTELRRRLGEDRAVGLLTPRPVIDLAAERRLYRRQA